MTYRLLGKTRKAAQPGKLGLPRPAFRPSWILTVLAPAVLIGTVLAIRFPSNPLPLLGKNAPAQQSAAFQASTTQVKGDTKIRVLGAISCPNTLDTACKKQFQKWEAAGRPIFPLLPKGKVNPNDPNEKDPGNILYEVNNDGTVAESTAPNRDRCAPAFWDMSVFVMLAYKVLLLLNWVAGSLAVIFTVYAGILYMTGFTNEGNVKKAKTLLFTSYGGFIIVLCAWLLVYSSARVVADRNIDVNSGNIPDSCSLLP